MYRNEYKKPWTFNRSGVVLLSNKNIVVLEEGTHLSKALPYIITDTVNCKKFGVPPSVAFDKWFDIVNPLDNNIISQFRLETTDAGNNLLQDMMLTNVFPAVIQEPINQRVFYFSGDFATNDICFSSSRLIGFEKLKGLLYSDKPDDTRRFFWLYYKPLINSIFTEYYNSLDGKK